MIIDLKPNDKLLIAGREYEVACHPVVPSLPFIQEGWKSWIYKLHQTGSEDEFALKVFKPAFRLNYIVSNSKFLKSLQGLPSYKVANRHIVTKDEDAVLINSYPDLDFAVLMPWAGNYLWSAIISQWIYLSKDTCISLACNFAQALTKLEEMKYAHCDIAGDNVSVNLETKNVELLDIEDIYGEGFEHPSYLSIGGYGYQHKTGGVGIWSSFGDRFSGAILLSEILVWHNPEIRSNAFGESYFYPNEMQDSKSVRYRLILDYLSKFSDKFAELFERAWYSDELKDCPKISEWLSECERVKNDDRGQKHELLESQLSDLKKQIDFGFSELKLGQAALYHHISSTYQDTIDGIIDVIRQNNLEQAEILQIVESIRSFLKYLDKSRLKSDHEFRQIIEKAETTLNSNIGISQKLEFTIPIIPLLLNYKVETGSDSATNILKLQERIKGAWEKMLLAVKVK